MTLIITIAAPWGIWQCSDNRLINPNTGKLEEDSSIKQVHLTCGDGTAILAYTGVGSIKGIHVSDWIRQVLRGESRSLSETVNFLREKATDTLGPYLKGKFRHIFNIGIFQNGKPLNIQLRNFEVKSQFSFGPPLASFEYALLEIRSDPVVIILGAWDALLPSDRRELIRIAGNYPKHMDDFHGLLAKYNLKASNHSKNGFQISPTCITTYLPPDGNTSSKVHDANNNSVELMNMPFLLFGVDMTEVKKVQLGQVMKMEKGEDPDSKDEFEAKLNDALKGSINTDDLLSS